MGGYCTPEQLWLRCSLLAATLGLTGWARRDGACSWRGLAGYVVRRAPLEVEECRARLAMRLRGQIQIAAGLG